MNFRHKTTLLVIVLTALTMGAAFAAVWHYFVTTQREELDRALLIVAHREAAEAAAGELEFSNAPGPSANAVGPLPKYGVVYTMYGVALSTTENMQTIPAMPRLARFGSCFDFNHAGIRFRAVVVGVPNTTMRVLLAVPRADLEDDARLLARAMAVAFVVGCGWVALIASFVAARLTRNYRIVEGVVRRVTGGDRSARVTFPSPDNGLTQLADNVNAMIDRLVELAAAQDRFVAHAAHELRTPLATLRIELEHALETARTAGAYQASMRGSLTTARRLSALVEDLLVVARANASNGAVQETSLLEHSLTDAVADVGPLARMRGVLVVATPIAALVCADRRSLSCVLRNLLENVVRLSSAGKTVYLDASFQDGNVCITIRDEGPNVPVADWDQPFGRVAGEGEYPGPGLGWSIARSLARAFHGDVTMEGGPGDRFIVTLPARASSTRCDDADP